LIVNKNINVSNDILTIKLSDEHNNIVTKELNVTIIKDNDLYIQKGWNLKALPVDKEINANIFKAKILWKYTNGKWEAYSSDKNTQQTIKKLEEKGMLKTFNTIKPAEGFWIYANEADVKVFDGKGYGIEKINLHNGWNLVGIGEDISIEQLKDKNIQYIWKYSNGKWQLWDKNINEETYKKYNAAKIDKIKKGEGFWVYYKGN
jgi:hypothetical protein